jgi:hypothetical protein
VWSAAPAIYDKETPMREDPNDENDRRRCRTCGRPWQAWHDPETGEGEGPHPDDVMIRGRSEPLACAIHRPTDIAPPWVGEALARRELAATASNLPAVADDAEIARREVAGGVPTREWPEPPSIPPREFLAAVVARAHENKAEA